MDIDITLFDLISLLKSGIRSSLRSWSLMISLQVGGALKSRKVLCLWIWLDLILQSCGETELVLEKAKLSCPWGLLLETMSFFLAESFI